MTYSEDCGKAGYPSRRIAENYLTKRIRENRTLDLRIYHCPICGLYHLTHKQDKYGRREAINE